MNCTLSLRVGGYSPYQVCAMVAKVVNANGSAQVGELADFWINAHAESL